MAREIFRAIGTVTIGVAGIIVASVQATGGTSPSGAMIAAALSFSYLFPKVLLTNDIGNHAPKKFFEIWH